MHAWVPEDFYLNNTPLQPAQESEIKILPSTLRVMLFVGESEEVYADVIPENTPGTDISWSLSRNGEAVRIYPQGRTCMIVAVSEGEEVLAVSCGGESVNIPVSVRESPKIHLRSFEYEEKHRAENKTPLKAYRAVVRILITLGAFLCFVAVFYIINNKVARKK